ncbi:MAG: hypothetical protein M3Y27_21425 [Acidobacteriota bacterium]|nr:hypothetical protein [Acidobacteriota bacterium]
MADAVWDMPFGKGGDRFADRLVKGFPLSGIFAAEAGRPYSAGISVPSIPFSTPAGTQYNGFGGLYGQSGLNLLPTVPRNSNIGDANYRLDLRVARDFHATEHLVLEIVAEGFNVFNRSNFTQFNSTAYFATATTATALVTAPVILTCSTNFGTPSSDNAFPDGTNARRFQLALRFRF